MKNYLKLMRVEQWVKNLFVFAPLFFSGNIMNAHLFYESLFAFVVFSFTASSIYILNDYVDIESDKKHPEKKDRPLASGAVSKRGAKVLFVLLILSSAVSILVGNYIFQVSLWKFGVIIKTYFILNIFYTFKLKHVAIVDICIIALGFVLRVLAGGYVTGIIVTNWAILLTFVLALVLAIGKRRGELINAQVSGKTRKALDGAKADVAADFKGGINAFRQKVAQGFDTSSIDQSGVVSATITFVVEKDGSISNIKITGANADFNQEAERTVKSIKTKWTPAQLKGKAVRSSFRMPISMRIE